jgi:hypothetical protein
MVIEIKETKPVQSFSRTMFEKKVNLGDLNSIDSLIGKILYFKKMDNIDEYQLYVDGVHHTFNNRFFLHLDNRRTISRQFSLGMFPEFVYGTCIEVSQEKEGFKFGLPDGIPIVIIKVSPI